jgi:C4-dicarboxylate-specific signal transduction histidine kinase
MQRGLRHHFTRKNAQAPNLTEQVDVFPLPGRKGRDGGVVIHIADITEKLSMEKQLIQADRLSSLGQMAGGIAHEIRNPLTGVRLFMDILSDPERFAIAPQQKEIMDEITENIVKIEGIIRRVLDLAKQKKPSMERIAVNDLIRKTLILWQARINKARIRLELELDSAIPVVQGDWIEIQQVLTNLVSNALEAMDAGGRLSIATRSGPSSLHPERQVVNIAVSDSGPGFSEDARRNVFTPFFTTKSAGTGLGLAISHKIIERHGGLIAVANHPEGGARFTIELNVAGA